MSKNELQMNEFEKVSGGVNETGGTGETGENFIVLENGEKVRLRKRKKTKSSSQKGNSGTADLIEQMQRNDDQWWEAWMGKR